MLRTRAQVISLACAWSVIVVTHVHAEPQQAKKEELATSIERKSEAAKRVKMVDIVRRHFEPSYLTYPIGLSGLPPLVIESNIVPHFVVNRPEWPFAFVLTPKIIVRMLREPSTPVRTPSYMPRASVYAWLTSELSPDETTAYASITMSHHSNGQSGDALEMDGSNNHRTGDFSTNFLELALYETRANQTYFSWNSIAFEWHLDIVRSAHLEDRYGLLRLKLASTILKTDAPLEGQLTAQVGVILDDFERESTSRGWRVLERFPVAIQYTVKVPGFDLGAYLGYFIGHDYYNIRFDTVINVIQVGLAGTVGPVLMEH